MNPWFEDNRSKQAQEDAFQAERAERRGETATAHDLYRRAGEGFAAVALAVGADHPNTRSDLGIAAVACFARAGDFGRAVDTATRLLAEDGALSEAGKAELHRMAKDYGALRASGTVLGMKAQPRGQQVRNAVRAAFRQQGLAA